MPARPILHTTTRALRAAVAMSLPPTAAVAAEFPIGVSFAENVAYLLDPAETAGSPENAHANWNNRGRWGNPSALSDATGTATPVTMKWDATGLWETGADPALGGNNKLMKGYLDSNGAAITAPFDGVFGNSDDKPLILVTGLDTWMAEKGITSYRVVIYSDGDSSAGDRAARVWLASTLPASPVNGDPGLGPDLTARVDIIDAASWQTTPAFTRVTGTSGVGNYTVFSGIKSPSFYIRVDEAGTGPWRAPVNGFQIIGTDVAEAPDGDDDGLPDDWESNYGFDPMDDGSVDPVNGPLGDPDFDDRTNFEEFTDGTNPRNADSDGDGLDDGAETDSGTDPLEPDSDGDFLPDGWEVTHGFNPLDDGSTDEVNGANGDPDAEGLYNLGEYQLGTDPRNSDTDGDGYDDLSEDGQGTWLSEFFTGTSAVKPDSDGDGIPDGQENPDLDHAPGVTAGTDPNLADTDADGQNDRWEIALGTDPTDAESKSATVGLTNGSFEQPDAAGTFLTGAPTGWTLANSTAADDAFVENLAAAGLAGGDTAQYAGIQEPGGYLHQDTGVAFQPNTVYLVDVSGGYRAGFPTGVLEFGLFSSEAVGTPLAAYPGRMDQNGVRIESGNPDADGIVNRLRDASALATIGTGSLGRPFVLVTGSTPPSGNLVAFLRHATGFRVMFDNIRILAVPAALDADADSLPDAWELASGLSPADDGSDDPDQGAAGDPDRDGSPNSRELALGSDPQTADTDGDGLPDGVESGTGTFVDIDNTGSSPVRADSDGDGLPDGLEISLGTDPNLADTDGDGFSDAVETEAGTDPLDDTDFPAAEPKVTVSGFVGGSFQLTVQNLQPGKTYTLARSGTLTDFSPIGEPVTGVSTHTFADDTPPEGSAFYRVDEVPAP